MILLQHDNVLFQTGVIYSIYINKYVHTNSLYKMLKRIPIFY